MSTASTATCAGCDAPIERGQKFVLHDTEVFHRSSACVMRRSRLTRERLSVSVMARRANELNDKLERAIEVAEHLNETTRRAVDAAEIATKRLDEEKAARRAAEESASLRKETLDTYARTLLEQNREITAARARVRELEEQLARVKLIETVTSDAADTTDGTALRFSLLELE